MTPAPPGNTISIRRLVKIAFVAAITFGAGFLIMVVVNGLAFGLAGAMGAHPTGRGNMSSQLIVGAMFAVLGAAVAAWWTRNDAHDESDARVHLRVVAFVLLGAVLTPLGVMAWRSSREAAADRQLLLHDVLSGAGDPIVAADSLARTSGGVGALRRLLGDAEAAPEARLIAGLELAEYRVATPVDLAQVEVLIRPPSPLRGRFVQIYAEGQSVDWSDTVEQWMVAVLDDPEPAMRLGALRALISHSFDGPRAREACPALQRLARDSDPGVRADAMLMASACPRDRIPELLKEGTQDPDPAVRLAVLKRLAWRFGGVEDTPSDAAIRRELASSLIHDRDPAVRAAAVARQAAK